jgi:16S rRNA (guanine(966)-N(2))-methyltransferase RsmD
MRVIGGEFRRRRLKTIPGMDTRPTPDRLREALFNVLAPRIEGAQFLDAYAGTGSVGIEALSRGAARAIFVEQARAALAVIHDNLKSLGVEDRAQVVAGKAAQVVGRYRPDIVFADPPYAREQEFAAVLDALAAAPPPLVVVQHPPKMKMPEEHGSLRRFRVLRQGDNWLSFYEPAAISPQP